MTVLRAARPSDVPALGALQRALETAWWGREETDDAEIENTLAWVGDLDARTRVLRGADGLVASAFLTAGGEADLAVHPGLPGGARAELTAALLSWLVATAQATGCVLELGAPRHDAERLAALAGSGLLPARSELDLELPPGRALASPVWPDGLALVPWADALAPGVHELVYSVWTDVPGHRARPYDEWRHLFLDIEPFDPGLQVVAVRDGAPVAAAVCRVYGGTDGWVSQLAVARGEQGLGLGRAVLLEALRRLRAAGTETVGLAVSVTNPRALRLYRGVGLEVTREWVVCTGRREAPAPPG